MREKPFARREQLHAARGAFEERLTEFVLELADLPGKRRLRQVQTFGRTAHVLLFRDDDERLNLGQAHGATIPKRYWIPEPPARHPSGR